MTRTSLTSKGFVSLLVVVLIGAWMAPGVADETESISHNWNKHYKRLAKRIFYTKGVSNNRFINVGEQASDAALLDGQSSTAFAGASHAHAGEDITSGTVAAARIDALLARDAEVFDIVLAADGTGSTLDADLLDGQSSTAFAGASHAHAGEDITSGTVDESVIDILIARVADVFDIVLAADGFGSGLDADLLDGQSSAAFAQADQSMAVRWFKESADSVATTATSERVIFTAPENLTITGVTVEPAAELTSSDTNFATFTILRRDANGANQVTVVVETTQTVGGGGTGDWTAFSTVSLGTLANTSLAAGQKLTLAITKTGLGVTMPIMSVEIEYAVG